MIKTFLIILLALPLYVRAQGLGVRSTNGLSVNQTLLNPSVEGYLRASEGATKTNATFVGTVNGTTADATFRTLTLLSTNLTATGIVKGGFGLASTASAATNVIAATGITNTSQVMRTAVITASGVVFTIKNSAGTVVYTSPSFTGTIPFTLQPTGAVTAASGLSGVLLDW